MSPSIFALLSLVLISLSNGFSPPGGKIGSWQLKLYPFFMVGALGGEGVFLSSFFSLFFFGGGGGGGGRTKR